MVTAEEIKARVAAVNKRIAALQESLAMIGPDDDAEHEEWRREAKAVFAELDAIEADCKASLAKLANDTE